MGKKKSAGARRPAVEQTGVTALYARVSTDAQFEEGYSLDAQLEKLRQWCALHEITNTRTYPDGGFSGSSLDRPAMQQLIDDIAKGQVCRVVVYKLDRLSRSQRDTVYLLEELFQPNGIDFISLSENFDTGTPYGKAMIGIFSVFAQLERENIFERTRMGMLERVKSGKWPGGGGTPFGYDYDPVQDKLIPNEHAEQVRQIYDLYLQGYSTTQLARMFPVANDYQISQILERVTYLGKISYKGERYDGNHQPIIDEATWQRVQLEHQRRARKRAVASPYLLTGLLVCGKCGAKMRYQKWGKQAPKIWCYSQQRSKPKLVKDPDCDNCRYDADALEQLVVEDLLRVTDPYHVSGVSPGSISARHSSGADSLQARHDGIAAKIKRLYNLYAEDGDPLLLATIEENKQELAAISRLLENERASEAAITRIAERQKAVANLRQRWPDLSFQEKQRVLRLCIDRILLTDGAVDIQYSFQSV